ncbi:hypothetical protein [Eubacterium aggregans]|uniref:hypothetical protein n=1 Tax=Eubacterium aggregans TaxID=81409 RepID=UPI003F67D55F
MSMDACELAISEEGEPNMSLWKNLILLRWPLMELAWSFLLVLRWEMNEVMVSREKSGKGMV